MPIAKKIPLMIPVWILDMILKHGIAVEQAMSYGALSTLDALERMIDDLIEIHDDLGRDVHQALVSQQPCADFSDAEETANLKRREVEGVELPCPDKNLFLN